MAEERDIRDNRTRYSNIHYEGKRKDVPVMRDDVDTCPEELSFQKLRDNIKAFLPSSFKPQSVAERGRSISRERKSSNFERSPPVLCDLAKKNKVLSSEMRAVTGVGDCCSSSTEPNPKAVADTSSLFDIVSREGKELNKVFGELGIRREKRLNSVVEKVQRAHQNRAMATSCSAYTEVMEIPACAVGTSSSLFWRPRAKKMVLPSKQIAPVQIPPLSVAWKSVTEVLKLAAADRDELVRQHNAEKVTLREQLEKEKKDQFEKEVAATKQEVEDEAKKTVDIAVASQKKLIQAFYFWGLSREDVNLALAGKYNEIIFLGDDASPVAEQTPAPPLADDKTEEEVVCLRGKVIKVEKALSRVRDFINRTQQVHNKLKYERRLHKSNFDNTFKELFELQCRYGKIKIERDEVLRKGGDRFSLLQKSFKDKRFVDESDKLECQWSLLSLMLYFEDEVDSERGLKEAYLELLTERGIVPDLARVKFLAQEARNRLSIKVQRCSARAEVSIIWGGVGPLPDELDFYRGKE
ncbi:hypothetical protein GIB67_015666 [Kingdonia uniflora]|uniref:Uncharacterized protein n=1 Tax=Kingdonia uniflora TaxID=39325 RepID=A0A7J7NUS6_9MAGN|nr:hypothetical protein GIB67_015666 [Kingdonia uniflora]